jgi:hypothetical protein
MAFHSAANIWFPTLTEGVIPVLPMMYAMFFSVSGVSKLYGGIMAYQDQEHANR